MIIGIPVYPGVDLLDVTGPHEIFSWMGDDEVDIRLLAEQPQDPIVTRGKFGLSLNVTHSLAEEQQLDVIWVPGGDPPELAKIMRGGAYLDFLNAQAKGAQWICSVCEGALLLAAAGLLKGYEATTHYYFKPCLKTYDGVTVVPGYPRFHQDRNRLTGGGISSGLDEAFELVRLLKGADAAKTIARITQYYPVAPYPQQLQDPPGCDYPDLAQRPRHAA